MKHRVMMTATHIGVAMEGSHDFLQKEKVKSSIFVEQQKKYHTIVDNLNKQL
jgi:hypothetical protein